MAIKRISHIVNPQGVRSEKLTRMEKRILRGADQAIDSLEDQLAETEEKAQSIIDSFGECGTGAEGDTARLQKKFNDYITVASKARALKDAIEDAKNLKTILNEEIEVTINPDHVVIDQK
jgi:hypothetical protein